MGSTAANLYNASASCATAPADSLRVLGRVSFLRESRTGRGAGEVGNSASDTVAKEAQEAPSSLEQSSSPRSR